MSQIYLDYNATTPIDPAVVETMLPYLKEHFGNPSSTHTFGVTAHQAVERARQQVAELIGAQPDEIVFTSGGTEATNHALKGAVFAKLHGLFGRWAKGAHLVTSAIEHPATERTCDFLMRIGCQVSIVPVDATGRVDPDEVQKMLTRGTTIVSIMHTNNEVGSLQEIRAIADMAHQAGALMHTDAAQSLGKVRVDVNELGVDLLSIAGHKLYAPKGVGALYIRRGVKLEPLIHGAGHEAGRRAGTENVPYLAGLGRACELARQSLPEATKRLRALRDKLWLLLQESFGASAVLHGHAELGLPNTLNVGFIGHIGAEVLQKVPAIAASTGSACHEGHISVSPVLKAMKVPAKSAQGAVRLSVGRFTTEDEIDRAAALLREALLAARN